MPIPKSKKGESKQGFLRRCVAARVEDGIAEETAFAECALACKQQGLADDNAPEILSAASCAVLAADEGAENTPRRFAILGYTGALIDRGWTRFVIDLSGITCKPSIPVLREHARDRIIGKTDKSVKDAAGLHFFGEFSKATADAAEVLSLSEEGFPWQASIGVSPLEVAFVAAGAKAKVNGLELEGPLDIWKRSEVGEISFVSLGADANTAAIVMARPEENGMDKRLRALLVGLGLPETATEEEALAFFEANKDKLELRAETPSAGNGASGTNTTPPVGADAALAAAVQAAANAAAAQALTAERTRVAGITELCAKMGLSGEFSAKLCNSDITLDKAREQVLAEMAQEPHNRPVQRMDFGTDESDKLRLVAVQGLCLAHGIKVENPDPQAREFRGMGLQSHVRMALERAGVNSLRLSPVQLADMLFDPKIRLAASVADFSAIFMDVTNKNLLKAYEEAGATFAPWVYKRNAVDFKEMYGISLSEAPDLDDVGENDEYKHGSLKDNKESFRVTKRGKIIRLSWEMVVNDDLGAFMRVPQLFGAATARKHSDVVYGLLVPQSVKMSDGKPLFHADHANLAEASAITDAGMNAMRLTMRRQTGMNGARLNLTPAFMLVPPRLENSALVMLKSAAMPTENMSGGMYNPWPDSRIAPIVEQRLEPEGDSPAPWFFVASPSQVATIDVAYLGGQEAPEIFEHQDFSVDAISYKVRSVMGAGAMDYRGFVKNPGKAG